LETQQTELYYIKEDIKAFQRKLKFPKAEIVDMKNVNILQDFFVRYKYNLEEINFGQILELYSLSHKIHNLKVKLESEEREKEEFKEQNSNFINLLYYAKKNIEDNYTSNECPLCNQSIELEILKQIIENNRSSFSNREKKIANLKNEIKTVENQFTSLKSKLIKEMESIVEFINTKLEICSNRLQQRTKIEQLEVNLSDYNLTLNQLNEKVISEIKDKYRNDIIESLKLVNKEEVDLVNAKEIKDYIMNYENKFNKHKDIIHNVSFEQLQIKINSVEKIIESNLYLSLKDAYEKVNKELNELKQKQKLVRKIRNHVNSAVNKVETTYKNELEEPINYVYRKINRHSNFSKINMSLPSGATSKKVDATVGNNGNEVNLSNVLSSGQITTVALSFFLGIALKKKFTKFNAYFFDDPIQHMDDLNILSFIDLLRVHLKEESFANQVFISTCNEDMDNLLVSKMQHFNIGTTKFKFKNYGEFEEVSYNSTKKA